MKPRITKILSLTIASLLFLGVAITAGRALDLGDVLKVGGIAYLVDRYDKPIDNFINKALGERHAQAKGATKVVPILSVGSGGYVGAAQVVGVPAGVQKTKAVLQVEIEAGSFRATGLLPIGKKAASKSSTRIKGVGVSAVIDFKI